MSNGSYFVESFQYGLAGQAVSRAALLRARILLHVLFTDRLVIPDSDILNNHMLRGLVSVDESQPDVPADLGLLLKEGRIAIAARDTHGSLPELREWQLGRNMPDVPTREYARLVEWLVNSRLDWSFDGVSQGFKDSALSLLAIPIAPDLDGAAKATIDWIHSQDVLYYSRFLEWKSAANLNPAGLQRVDRDLTFAYSLGIPRALHLDYAGPADSRSPARQVVLAPVDANRDLEAQDVVAPTDCFAINPLLLGMVPMEIILEIIEGPNRQRLLAEFAKVRLGAPPNWSAIGDSFLGMMDDLNVAAVDYFRHADMPRALDLIKEIRPKARLRWLAVPGAEAAADVILNVSLGAVSQLTAAVELALFGCAVYVAGHEARKSSVVRQRDERSRRRNFSAQNLRPDERVVTFPQDGQLLAGLQRLVAEPDRLDG
jgi:hypothetical protein